MDRVRYLKYFTVIFSGGLLAQIIYFATIPLLSRLYSVEDFAQLSIFASLLVILNSISCLRYDVAITLAEKKSDVFKLCLISFIISTVFSIVLLIILLIGAVFEFWSFFWLLLGFSVWFSSVFNIYLNYCLRWKKYKKISSIKVAQVALMSTFQILIAYVYPRIGAIGLILGQMINYLVGGIFQLKKVLMLRKIKKINIESLREVGVRYLNYFKFSTFDSIFNLVGLHLPIILLTLFYDKLAMGLFYMGMRLIQTPLSLIMSSIGQLYYSNIQENTNSGVFFYTLKFVFVLILIAVFGSCGYLLIAGNLIDLILGDSWKDLPEMTFWLLPWFIMQLIASPISSVMYVINSHQKMMYLTLFGFIIRVVPLFFLLNIGSIYVIEIFCLLNSLYYFICLLVFLFCAKKYGEKS